jgi:hypothetical protein
MKEKLMELKIKKRSKVMRFQLHLLNLMLKMERRNYLKKNKINLKEKRKLRMLRKLPKVKGRFK